MPILLVVNFLMTGVFYYLFLAKLFFMIILGKYQKINFEEKICEKNIDFAWMKNLDALFSILVTKISTFLN